MKCNVLDSWIQSLSCENLVMTEVKKPSNRPLVLSNAAAALQYKDHQPTCLHPITWSTMHLSNSGKLSLILSVKTVSVKHISRSNKKFLTVHVSNMKNLLIWSHPSVALSQGATSSTVSCFFFFFLGRWGRLLSLMSTPAFTKWQQRHQMLPTPLGRWSGYNGQCRAHVVQKECQRQQAMERVLHLHLDHRLHSWGLLSSHRTAQGKDSPRVLAVPWGWSPHTFTHEAAAGEKGLRVTCTLCNYLSLTICIKWLHSAAGRGTLLCWRQIPALMSASFPSLFWLTAKHVSSLWIMEWDGTELPGPGNLCQNFGW